MIKYRQLNSILNLNGKNYIVHITSWAQQRLNEQDLNQFNLDFENFLIYVNQAVADGNIVILPNITETINTSVGPIKIVIGEQFLIKEGFPQDSGYAFWQNKMSQDSAIIYYPMEIIS
jgi:hypothetical protein